METIILPTRINPDKPKTLLNNIPQKISHDAHLKRLCQQGRLREAIFSVNSSSTAVRPSTVTYLIESCIASNNLELCHMLHTRVRDSANWPDPFLGSKMVGMYAKCGSLADALKVFDGMPERNLYAWSAVIGACSRANKWDDVVELFYQMMADGSAIPDDLLFLKVFHACGNSGDDETGRLIHGMVIKAGMIGGLSVSNSILALYVRCGCFGDAKRFFAGMGTKDRVSWNTIVTGYCRAGQIDDARRLFKLMCEEGLEPDVVTWNVLIARCNQSGKCDAAMKLLNEMQGCGVKPDVFTWSSMILGFAHNNSRLEALKLFKEMIMAGVEPNDVALMSAVSACSAMKDVQRGKEVHLVAVKLGYGEDVLVGNSLVDMYSKCGKLEAARLVFDSILKKDVYSWNSMIGGYYQAGYCSVAHDLFKQMQASGVPPNVITLNVMITGYIQSGDVDQATDLFHKMEKKWGVKPDTASWNALISGYMHHGRKDKALSVFRRMQSCGMKPNSVTILSILPACANLIALRKVKEIHCRALRSNLESELSVANCLIDVYAKSGNVMYSEAIFNGMSSTDIITWNAMIAGYVLHGRCHDAIELFSCMKRHKCKPNRTTFASVVLAYARAGLVDEGQRAFTSMTEEYQIFPCLDHYVAMVNLYGRSGMLDKAYDFIKMLAVEPAAPVWSAFLVACCRLGNVKLAIHASEKVLELEPDNTGIWRLLAKLYDLCGISKDSLKKKGPALREDSKEFLGQSWIEDKNIVHTFVTSDPEQQDHKSLHCWFESMDLTDNGSKYHDWLSIEEEEKETPSGVHSEKLAMAFALIKSPQPPETIRIMKNLRMCGHCHWFGKMVSQTNVCKIYINDSVCLHHFKNGSCSCGDYW